MDDRKFLADRFEADRDRLRGVAYRMLGTFGEAEDAVQEAWLRLNRSEPGEIGNLSGWLTTVTARVCLDMLRSRRARREEPIGPATPEPAAEGDPEREAALADSVGLALLVVLERLAPAERLAFVLHDLFAVPFDEIAPIVERSPEAARQLASRARRRVQGGEAAPDRERQKSVLSAFLAASRGGDFAALLSVLDPQVVFRADAAAVRLGSLAQVRGAEAVAKTFVGRATGAEPALVDDGLGLVVAVGGRLRVVLRFTIEDGRVVGVEAIGDPDRLAALSLEAF